MKKRLFVVAIVAFLLGVAFLWGYLAHRFEFFPHSLMDRVVYAVRDFNPSTERPVKPQTPDVDPLKALPYVDATFDPNHEKKGVTVHDADRSFPGFNFYTSEAESKTFLLTMRGTVRHEWSYKGHPEHATLLPDGSILISIMDEGIRKISRDSELLWSFDCPAHHDLAVDDEGKIFAMVRRPRLIPQLHATQNVFDDGLVVLSPDGEELEWISLVDILLDSPYAGMIPVTGHLEFGKLDRRTLDIVHSNHVSIFDGSLAEQSEIFKKGNLLISFAMLNALVIFDPENREAVWWWGPNNVVNVHHPTLLENGKILFFNNGAEASRILEVDPLTHQITWSFEEEGFFSFGRGSVQRLPNGNTLITESNTGYVFEVTPDGERVWEFANPNVSADGERGIIWRMSRFAPEELAFLN